MAPQGVWCLKHFGRKRGKKVLQINPGVNHWKIISHNVPASLAFYMLTDSGFQREISYTKYQERITILSCIYFTFIVLQIEKKLLSWNPRPTHGVHKTNRVKERVFNIWAALTGLTKLNRYDETKASVQLISLAIWQRFIESMYWEKLLGHRTQSDYSKGIMKKVARE